MPAPSLGAVSPSPPPTAAAAGPEEGSPTLIDHLERLCALHASGALSAEEFAQAKQQILASAAATDTEVATAAAPVAPSVGASDAAADALPPPPAATSPPDPAVEERIAALLAAHPDNICLSTFDPAYYAQLGDDHRKAFMRCLSSGIENPDSGMGCYACQPDDYDRFKPFFSKALAKYHKVAEDAKHANEWSLEGVEGLPEGGVLDLAALGLPELSMRVRVGRNLRAFPLPGAMTQAQRCEMEKFMLRAFEVLFSMPDYGGRYCSFTPGHPNFVDEAEYQALVDAHIAFKDMSADKYLLSAGIAAHWPYGRGVYISEDKGFIIWVGEEDHLRIMCMKKGTVLNEVFDRLKSALDVVNGIEGLEFAVSENYGVVTSCPTNLGTGMRASVHIQLPSLTSDGTDTQAKAICKPLGGSCHPLSFSLSLSLSANLVAPRLALCRLRMPALCTAPATASY
eukprot:COSAG01_NODE_4037_length_5412_cov_5.603614_2_plen_455_part_00